MIRALYNWTLRLAGHRHADWALAGVSFAESSVFPIPPDVLLVPMVLSARQRAWWIATVCTVASVLGGLAGYAIGAFLFAEIGRPVLELYGYLDTFGTFQDLYHEWGFWIVFGGGFTPIPYKVITIASGVANLDLMVFVVASLISRGGRFFIEAALLWYLGQPMRAFIERHLNWLALTLFLLAVGGVIAVKLLI